MKCDRMQQGDTQAALRGHDRGECLMSATPGLHTGSTAAPPRDRGRNVLRPSVRSGLGPVMKDPAAAQIDSPRNAEISSEARTAEAIDPNARDVITNCLAYFRRFCLMDLIQSLERSN